MMKTWFAFYRYFYYFGKFSTTAVGGA